MDSGTSHMQNRNRKKKINYIFSNRNSGRIITEFDILSRIFACLDHLHCAFPRATIVVTWSDMLPNLNVNKTGAIFFPFEIVKNCLYVFALYLVKYAFAQK